MQAKKPGNAGFFCFLLPTCHKDKTKKDLYFNIRKPLTAMPERVDVLLTKTEKG
jgi:hypothetical protein